MRRRPMHLPATGCSLFLRNAEMARRTARSPARTSIFLLGHSEFRRSRSSAAPQAGERVECGSAAIIHLTGVSSAHRAGMVTLRGATYQATNSVTDPDAIHPEQSTVSVPSGVWHHTVPALTIEVIDVRIQ